MKQLITLSVCDFKIMFRDPSLRVFLFLPIAIFLVINYFLPYLIGKFPVVNDYVIYVVIIATIQVVQMFGFIYSMILIDEKETDVAKIYGILPVSKIWFIIFRLLIPSVLTSIFTWLILMAQPFYTLSPWSVLAFSILIGFMVPVYVIGIVNLCKNRMEAMIWIKIFNVLAIIPAVAFFIPGPSQHVFGIFPSHWAFQGMYGIIQSNTYQWQLGLGFLYFMVLLYIFVRKFSIKHFV